MIKIMTKIEIENEIENEIEIQGVRERMLKKVRKSLSH